ncbi:MAG: ATP-binding protein [Firmicutes bacterium]|uniref:ATP-binding protein n=1 Tax=Candidatus Onthovivens merdipullorum TaxID=2840889 RepID=A0A9D9GWW8_9BACL|nr:ATP-binding protein [Candidatus Onthovivens merdipullorum]
MNKIFKRKIYNDLLEFKKDNGKYALLIEGARRVGKSTIVEEFAKNEYKSYIFIDFQNDKEKARLPFKELPNLNAFFDTLSLYYGSTKLYERESLIIFDEIQLFPEARETLKQLVKDGRYDYIETGSLISINKNVKDILLPSEEKKIPMYPLSFEEFLNATGDSFTFDLLKKYLKENKEISDTIHQEMIRKFKTYMVLGGMPKVIDTYNETKSFFECDKEKELILELYKNDLHKLDDDLNLRASLIYKSIPSSLSNHFKDYNNIKIYNKNNSLNKKNLNSFDALIDSKVVLPCYLVSEINLTPYAYIKDNKFKLYFSDTGLFITQILYNAKKEEKEMLYKSLISNKLSINEGNIFENMVAQELTYLNNELYYYTYYDEAHHTYEIDFLIYKNKKVIPIEVKSNSIRFHTSLDKLQVNNSKLIKEKIIISNKPYFKKDNLINIPIYLLEVINCL